MEQLTDQYEQECAAIIEKIEDEGGMVAAVQEGRIQRAITDEAHQAQLAIDHKQRPIVGVNIFTNDNADPADVEIYQPPEEETERQLRRLAQVRASRDTREVEQNLHRLRAVAQGDGNLMPPLLDCVRAYCTVGEITNVLRDVFGEFDEPTAF